jgi:hypothetical protein
MRSWTPRPTGCVGRNAMSTRRRGGIRGLAAMNGGCRRAWAFVSLKMPKLRTLPFETAIIERYKRRETSVEEALIEMYRGHPLSAAFCA